MQDPTGPERAASYYPGSPEPISAPAGPQPAPWGNLPLEMRERKQWLMAIGNASLHAPYMRCTRHSGCAVSAEVLFLLMPRCARRALGALLTAPPFLSGLTDAQVKVFTEQHNRKANPLLTKRLTLMKTAHEKLANAGSLFIVQSERAQGVPPNVVAQLRAAQSKAEAAFR